MENRRVLWLLIVLLCTISMSVYAAPQCEFRQWSNYKQTKLHKHVSQSTYAFLTSHMQVDADGSPNAYHPKNLGLDYLANAGYPNSSWWQSVLVPDPENPGQAYTQKSGPFSGYFVSKTSLQDKSKPITDPLRYVDASRIPYLVFPGSFFRMKGSGRLGDLGIAINIDNGKSSAFVVADVGPSKAQLGEVSIALAEGLGGGNVNPKNGSGTPSGRFLYVVFPNSSRTSSWPLSLDDMANRAAELIKQSGGMDALMACKGAL